MSLLVCWVAFPLALAAISIGCGLLLEQASGRRLPGALLLPAGLALVIVAAGFATLWDATAELALPLVVGLAVVGFVLAFPWRDRAVDWWAVGAAVATFAVFAAPIVLSGSATFAGYITLDDTATWLALTDRAMEHGRSLAGLAPSTYQAILGEYMGTGYPLGAFLPLGVGHKLVGQDSAWLFQPLIAFYGASLALGLYALISRLVGPRPVRALVAFVAAQPALLYAYGIWSGIKEFAAAALIVLAVALLSWTVAELRRSRELVPAAVAIAALMITLTVAGAVWLAGAALAALALALQRYGRRIAVPAAFVVALALALAVPALVTAGGFFRHATAADVLTKGSELGNLVRPLNGLQLLGIWPAGDFRFSPGHRPVTYVLIAMAIAAALVGLVWAVRRRAWGVALYAGTAALGCAVFVSRGSPWVDGKALVTAAPAFVLVGMLGAAFLLQSRWRLVGAALGAAVAGGVLWSNALAYHQVWLAPRGQLRELETIGKEFAGQGPALMTEFQPYGPRHFLRELDAEGASEFRRRLVPLRTGRQLAKGQYADIDDFQLSGILVYRTLVLRRSPIGSRPPSSFELVRPGRFYDVWQRVDGSPRILEHYPLGGGYQAGGRAPCGQVERLARVAQAAGGRLVAATSAPTVELDLSRASLPSSWEPASGDPASVLPRGSGRADATVFVPVGGSYGVWLGGSFRGRAEVSVDGRTVGAQRHRLNWTGQFTGFGDVILARGEHRVTLRYEEGGLRPGSGGEPFPFGPLVLARSSFSQLPFVDAVGVSSLCGRRLDWIEAVQ